MRCGVYEAVKHLDWGPCPSETSGCTRRRMREIDMIDR